MQLLKELDWQEPLDIANNMPEYTENWVFLYSGLKSKNSGKYSIIAFNAVDMVQDDFTNLSAKLSDNKKEPPFINAWFGYLGYGLKNELERLSIDKPSFINAPNLLFMRFSTIIVFNHKKKRIQIWQDRVQADMNQNSILQLLFNINHKNIKNKEGVKVENFTSNMTKDEYLQKVSNIKDLIRKGDVYQANLTRKFYGNFIDKPQPFDIFYKLCKASPAPYSAFIKFRNLSILSSSPERFLHIDKNGNANTRPIKGSVSRETIKAADKLAKQSLKNSEKNKAENLMIVDLCRNDLARGCKTGSIEVKELFTIESYANVHHMVSSVSGKKLPNLKSLDLVKYCFPPGSMTGAPKIKAMEISSHLEGIGRGIYSGAIGWFGGDGSVDLSVIIRTIILQDNKFEFQVGGAIVHDSIAQDEFNETVIKAKGVMQISISKLINI